MSFSYVLPENQYFTQVQDVSVSQSHIAEGVSQVIQNNALPTVYTLQNNAGKLPVLTVGAGSTATITTDQIQALVAPGFLYVDANSANAGSAVSFGADTAAVAKTLVGALGLTQTAPARLLEFKMANDVGASAVEFTNGGATANYVTFSYAGGAASFTAAFLPAAYPTNGSIYVIASIAGYDEFSNVIINFNTVYP